MTKKKKTQSKNQFGFEKLKDFDTLPLKNLFIFSIAFSALTIAFVFWGVRFLPPEVPVFYGKPVSQERLGESGMLVLPAFSALIMTVINLVAALFVKNQYFKKVLAGTSLTITLFAITTTVKIFFLIGIF
jgi:hypothetical protein